MIETTKEEFNLDFYNFFASVAKEVNCTIKSLCSNYIFEVFSVNKKKKFYIIGNALPLNNNVAQKICADKVATSTVLSLNKVSCVPHHLLKNPDGFKNWDNDIFEKLIKENKTVVVKDNQGTCGVLAFKAENVRDFKKYAQIIFNEKKDVAVCPFINYDDEYRLIMLNNRSEICFKKVKPFVVGDGKTNVFNLIQKKYGKQGLETLEVENKFYKPKQNEKVCVGWKNNLAMLASAEEIEDKDLKRNLEALAKSCTKALNINFCSVDIINDNGVLKVLEVNSTVSALRYCKGDETRQKLLKNVFKKAFQLELDKK